MVQSCFKHIKRKVKSAKNYVGNRVKGRKRHDVSHDPDNPPPFHAAPAADQSVDHSTPSGRAENNSNEQEIPMLIPPKHAIDKRASPSGSSHGTKCHTENDNTTPPNPDHPAQKENNMVGTESTNDTEILGPNQLWTAAYNKIKEDPKVKAYEALLQESCELTDSSEPLLRGEDWQKRVQRHAQERLEIHHEDMFSVSIGGNKIILREQVQKVIGIIVSARDLVAAAISTEPHAALAWAGVMFVFPLLDKMLKQDEDALNGFDDITTILVRCKIIEKNYLSTNPRPSDNEYQLIISLESKIVDLYSKVYQYLISIIHHFDHSSAARYFRDIWATYGDDWKGLAGKIKSTDNDIWRNVEALSYLTLNKVDGEMENIQIQLKHFEVVSKTVETVDLDASLSELSPASSAAFNYYDNNERQSHCTQGTRLEILSELQKWIQDPTGEPILWLHGMAGTGKSTVARTVAKALNSTISLTDGNRLPNNISLGATFFFKRDDDTRNNVTVLFRTLGYQLAYQRPDLKSQISDAIKRSRNHNIQDQSPMAQWDTLILKPLESLQKGLSSTLRIILIIDALDECQNNNRAIDEIFRQSFPEIEKLSQIEVRVLITSRRESHLDTAFKSLPSNIYRSIELSKVQLNKHNQMENDISIFLKDELSHNDMNRSGSFEWPNQNDFRKLVERTGGLFMYAATACKFLDVKPRTLAKHRLKTLLSGSTNRNSPESALNDIYRKVLSPYTQGLDEFDQQEDDPLKEIKEILRVIVMLFKPLPTRSLAEFTSPKMRESDVKEELELLRPVIDLPDDPRGSVNLVHLSFREFLLDEDKCGETGFLVQPSTMHFPLFRRCLEIMSDELHEDICSLQKPGTLSADVPLDLVQQHISPHLRYGCRYWIDHLLAVWESPQAQGALIDGGIIHMFLQKHILNWLEVLGLTKEVATVSHLVSRVNTLINEREYPELSKLIYDAYRFILFNRRIVEDAPLQVYYSAVFFSPTNSVIKSLFQKPLDEWIVKAPIVDEGWGAELMTLEGFDHFHDWIRLIAISLDNQTIAAASFSQVRVWEVATGIETANFPIPGNAKKIALSPDGQIVTSISYKNPGVQLGDLRTDEFCLLGQNSELIDMVFNPSVESRLLALLSKDKKLDLWNISTKEKVYTYDIDIGDLPMLGGAIAFSPDGALVTSVISRDAHGYTVHCDTVLYTWSVNTGELVSSFNRKFKGAVKSIEFSPSGTSLAFVSDQAIAIYDTESNAELLHESIPLGSNYSVDWRIHTDSRGDMKMDNKGVMSTAVIRKMRILDHHPCPTFFPNGRAVAYAGDMGMRINDVTNETDDIQSSDLYIYKILILNNDDALIMRHSHLEVWDLEKLEVKRRYLGEIDSKSYKISPDGKTLVAWNHRLGDYCLFWNIATDSRIKCFEDIRVRGAEFSPDGEFLALALDDGVLQILEAASLRERIKFDTGDDDLGIVKFLGNNKIILWAPLWAPRSKRYLCLGDIETGQCLSRMECYYEELKISHDGTVVAFSTLEKESGAYLLQTDTGNVKAKLSLEKYFNSKLRLTSFSPDSAQVALIADGWMINTCDTTTGENTKVLKIDYKLPWRGNIEISSDGKVAIDTTKSGVMIWDPLIDKWSSPSSQPTRWDDGLSFSKDGKYLEGPKGRMNISASVKDYNCLFVNNDWVLQGGERLLWLPLAYRQPAELSPVKGGIIIIRNTNSSAAIIKVDLEKTPLAKIRS